LKLQSPENNPKKFPVHSAKTITERGVGRSREAGKNAKYRGKGKKQLRRKDCRPLDLPIAPCITARLKHRQKGVRERKKENTLLSASEASKNQKKLFCSPTESHLKHPRKHQGCRKEEDFVAYNWGNKVWVVSHRRKLNPGQRQAFKGKKGSMEKTGFC